MLCKVKRPFLSSLSQCWTHTTACRAASSPQEMFSSLLLAETPHSPVCSLAASPQFREKLLSILQDAALAQTQPCLPPQPAAHLPASSTAGSPHNSNLILLFKKKSIHVLLCSSADLTIHPYTHGSPTRGSLTVRTGCCTQTIGIPCVLTSAGFNCCSALTFPKDASLLLLCRACLCSLCAAISSLEPWLMNAAC